VFGNLEPAAGLAGNALMQQFKQAFDEGGHMEGGKPPDPGTQRKLALAKLVDD